MSADLYHRPRSWIFRWIGCEEYLSVVLKFEGGLDMILLSLVPKTYIMIVKGDYAAILLVMVIPIFIFFIYALFSE